MAATDPKRWSPAIHVNQVGYLPGFSKKAMIGYYLGSLGELDLGDSARAGQFSTFNLLEATSGKVAHQGRITGRPDKGFTFSCYQRVLEADFSDFKRPGEYRLQVPGLGVSYRFFIDDGIGAAFARAYALGLYHQRCGAADVFPSVAELDNLGIPESGDGKSDVLQEAKWEAEFLAKMQDADGGFFFLVYPREREYENDVTPDHGDPQLVWPKTTSVTAAAVAALAQCASSLTFKKQFPDSAAA